LKPHILPQEGEILLYTAFNTYLAAKYESDIDAQPSAANFEITRAKQAKIVDAEAEYFGEKIKSGIFKLILTKPDGSRHVVPPEDLASLLWPESLVWYRHIDFFPGEKLAGYNGCILTLKEDDYHSWLKSELQIALFEMTMSGKIDRKTARVRASNAGILKLDALEKLERDEARRHEAEIDRFQQIMRWELVPSLVWIATRDIALTFHIANKRDTFKGADIHLSLTKPKNTTNGIATEWPLQNLTEAWQLLGQAMAEKKVLGLATRVKRKWNGGFEPALPGVIIPPEEALGAFLQHLVMEENGTTVVKPDGWQGANSWIEFTNVTFERFTIETYWPEDWKPLEIAEDKSSDANERGIWTHAEAAMWIATGDARKPGPGTIMNMGVSDGNGKEASLEPAWQRLLDKLRTGEIKASSNREPEVSSWFWRNAIRHVKRESKFFVDVFTHESEPTFVGPLGKRNAVEHWDIKLAANDIRKLYGASDNSAKAVAKVPDMRGEVVSNRPPKQREAAKNYLRALNLSARAGKLEALVEGLKVQGVTVSTDTMRRARNDLVAKG
jgi:hypothetical protein